LIVAGAAESVPPPVVSGSSSSTIKTRERTDSHCMTNPLYCTRLHPELGINHNLLFIFQSARVVVPRSESRSRVDGALSSVSGPIRTWASVRVSDTVVSRNTLLATSGSLYASCDFRHALMMRALFGQTTHLQESRVKKDTTFLQMVRQMQISRGAFVSEFQSLFKLCLSSCSWVGGVQ
jgi:hypothetical protein